MPPLIRGGYNRVMRRPLSLLAVPGLVLVLVLAVLVLAPDVLLLVFADPVMAAGTVGAGEDVNAEPLLPYVVGLLVTGVALALVGVVATRLLGRTPGRRTSPGRPDAWWVCPACQATNAEGRPACYACHAPRAEPPAADRGSTALNKMD